MNFAREGNSMDYYLLTVAPFSFHLYRPGEDVGYRHRQAAGRLLGQLKGCVGFACHELSLDPSIGDSFHWKTNCPIVHSLHREFVFS